MAQATEFKTYQTSDGWGIQLWFDDGTSMRQEPFESESEGLAWMYETHRELRTEFHYAFQITRLNILFVDYYTLGGNRHPYYATSAWEYCRSKMGVTRAGQCQGHATRGYSRRFWKEFDHLHLRDLSGAEYVLLLSRLEDLKARYNHISEKRRTFAGTSYHLPDWKVRELSMMDLKNPKDSR